MKFWKTILLVCCGVNHGAAFAPSASISGTDLLKTHVSTPTPPEVKEQEESYLSFEDVGVSDWYGMLPDEYEDLQHLQSAEVHGHQTKDEYLSQLERMMMEVEEEEDSPEPATHIWDEYLESHW